jgi:hypothetical protein
MKKIILVAAASMLASASMIGIGAAQMNNSTQDELRISQGASEFAPGQQQSEPGGASEMAPGRADGPAQEAAPGQQMQASDGDEDAIITGATGQPNFGTVISTLRSGQMDIVDVEADARVNLIEIDDLAPTGERQALDNAVADRQNDIDALRDSLRDASLDELEEADIDRVVAAQVEADGSVTLYLQ